MSRRLPHPFTATRRAIALFAATLLLAGCDGEPTDYSGERYDILFTWVDGNEVLDRPAVYGSLGVAAADNQPGARHGALSWKDGSGNFWLFGGEGFDAGSSPGLLQDLWKYDPAGGQWTWVGGHAEIAVNGTSTGAGHYGTGGLAAPDNLPGARRDAVTWTDGSVLWLFGGFGQDRDGNEGRLNDLWRYDIAAGQWTWVKGSDLKGQAGSYGASGTAADGNVPGGRHSATGWRDSTGKLWLFGGSGFDGSGGCCLLNDLWSFDPGTGQWTWVKGSDTHDPLAVYGTQGTAAAANTPSGRYNGVSWVDHKGNAWIYGGTGNDDDGIPFTSAELWKYTAGGWTWVQGAKHSLVTPVYDSRGYTSLTALPGSRTRAITWSGSDGSLWLFGGGVANSTGFLTHPNDLWRYRETDTTATPPVVGGWRWEGGKGYDNAGGNYKAIGDTGQPGGREGANGWIGGDGRLWLFGGDNSGFDRNDLWYYEP